MQKQNWLFKSFWPWFLVALFFINIFGGWYLNLYNFWYFDVIMHFLGGFGVFFLVKKYFNQTLRKAPLFDSVLLLVGITVFVGVVWEFYEFAFSKIWAIRPDGVELIGDLLDTIYDLAMDTLGAIFASALHFFRRRKA